jgi:hypothetical protein
MGYHLYREIRDGAPPEWRQTERLVALVIADDAGDKTRRSWLPIEGRWYRGRWQDGICERTGLTPRGVRAALHRLAKRGYELRVPISTGKDGRPVYAARGRSTDFYVPPLPPRPAPERRHEDAAFEDGKAARMCQKGGTNVPERRHDHAAPLLMSPQISLSPYAQLVSDRLPEATPEEREMILKRIEAQEPKSFPAYFRSIPDADLKAMLEEIRGQPRPRQAAVKPPWCGACDEDTRLRELPDGRVTRCPDCHPRKAGGSRQDQGGLP